MKLPKLASRSSGRIRPVASAAPQCSAGTILDGPIFSTGRCRTKFFIPAIAFFAGVAIFAAGPSAKANTEDDVINGQTDLTLAATYSGGLPTATSDVTFTAQSYSPSTFTVPINLSIGTLDDLATNVLTITGGTNASILTLNGGADSVAGSNAADLIYVKTSNFTIGSGTSSTLSLYLAAAGNIDIAGGTTTINAAISDGGNGFTKTGGGTLVLTGANTYTGATTISSGTLQIGDGTTGHDSSFGASSVIFDNATLAFNTFSAQSYGGTIVGSGALTKTGTGTLTLSSANFYTGNTSVSGTGTLLLTNSQALQNSALTTGGTGLSFSSSVYNATAGNSSYVIGGLNGGTTLALADSGGNPVALTLHPQSGSTDTYNSALTGAGSLTVAGTGTQVLGGTNTYTGGTTVSLGTLTLDFNQTNAPTSNILYNGVTQTATQTLTMGGVGASTNADKAPGANLVVNGKNAAGTNTQTFYGLTLNYGLSNISITPNGGGNVQLNFTNGLTHNAGGLINFTDTQSATNFISLGNGTSTGTLNDATGIIGGYATVNGTDYASVNASGQVVAYTGYTVVGTASGYGTTTAPTIASNTANNLKIDSTSEAQATLSNGATTSGSNTVTVTSTNGLFVGAVVTGTGIPSGSTVTSVTNGTSFKISNNASATGSGLTVTETSTAVPLAATGITDVNTIVMSDTTTPRDINVGSGNTLRFGVNGGILLSGTGTLYIGNTPANNGTTGTAGTLTAGGPTLGNPGEISLIARNSSSVNINSVIANNNASTGAANSTGGGAVTLTIGDTTNNGNTQVTLNGNNTYSGGTYLEGSRVQANTATAFGTGPVYVLPGAQAYLNGGGTTTNTFYLSGTQNDNFNFGALRLTGGTVSGNIILLGDATIGGNGAIIGNLSGTGSVNLSDLGGTLTVGSPTSTDKITGNFGINGFAPGVPGQTSYSGPVKLGGTTVLPNMSANSTSTGNVVIDAANSVTETLDLNGYSNSTNGIVATGPNVAYALITNTGGTGGSATLTIGDNNANAIFGGKITDSGTGKTLGITKAGTGTQTFTGVDTYIGATTINGGTLALGVTNTLAKTSGISVATTGTLSLQAGNALATPGATTGTLNTPVSVSGQVPISLGGGTLLRNGTGVSLGSQSGTSGTVGLGALTLTGASTLNFGTTGVGTLNFNSFSDPTSAVLTVTNYTSTYASTTDTGAGKDGTDDRLIFNQNLTSAQLSDFSINGATPTQIALGNGEFELIAPVPEASTWISGLLLLGVTGFHQRRRIGGVLAHFGSRTRGSVA